METLALALMTVGMLYIAAIGNEGKGKNSWLFFTFITYIATIISAFLN